MDDGSKFRGGAWVLGLAAVLTTVLVSGGTRDDPVTPPALPGRPPPFLGVALVGSGGVTAAIDAYGDVVDLRAPGPAGEALIENPSDRQAAGSVPADTGIVPRLATGAGAPMPLWRAQRVRQRYLPATSVLRTTAVLGDARITITDAALGQVLARTVEVTGPAGEPLRLRMGLTLAGAGRCRSPGSTPSHRSGLRALSWTGRGRVGVDLVCDFGSGAAAPSARRVIASAARSGRRWTARALPLGPAAPAWATRIHERSLLVLRTLTDHRTGAFAAGIRDGWAYVWPRDAAAAAIALAAAGYRAEATKIARFLGKLDVEGAARFHGDASPVTDGRAVQGDEAGWVRAAARATGLPIPTRRLSWRGRGDYGERGGERGDYLGNAVAAGVSPARIGALFGTPAGLVRRAGDPASGLDSAAAWAVRPFPRPALAAAVQRSLRLLASEGGRFGIEPSRDWPGNDPWTAPTAWSAWSLAALGDRPVALALLGDLRRAETDAGDLPERVGAATGVPRSTTPLGWSHAFASLALGELYPRH